MILKNKKIKKRISWRQWFQPITCRRPTKRRAQEGGSRDDPGSAIAGPPESSSTESSNGCEVRAHASWQSGMPPSRGSERCARRLRVADAPHTGQRPAFGRSRLSSSIGSTVVAGVNILGPTHMHGSTMGAAEADAGGEERAACPGKQAIRRPNRSSADSDSRRSTTHRYEHVVMLYLFRSYASLILF